jgi:hypothetical protein
VLKSTDRWRDFERSRRRRPTSHERNLRVYEALWDEARALGTLPPDDPLEGITNDIRRTRRLRRAQHRVRTSSGEDRADP